MARLWRILAIMLLVVAVAATPGRIQRAGMESAAGSPPPGMVEGHHHGMEHAAHRHPAPADVACAKWCAMQCGSLADAACAPATARSEGFTIAAAVPRDRFEVGLNPDPAVPPPRNLI